MSLLSLSLLSLPSLLPLAAYLAVAPTSLGARPSLASYVGSDTRRMWLPPRSELALVHRSFHWRGPRMWQWRQLQSIEATRVVGAALSSLCRSAATLVQGCRESKTMPKPPHPPWRWPSAARCHCLCLTYSRCTMASSPFAARSGVGGEKRRGDMAQHRIKLVVTWGHWSSLPQTSLSYGSSSVTNCRSAGSASP